MEAKQTRNKFNISRARAKKPLEIVHTDLCSPISPDMGDGHKYLGWTWDGRKD